jgi:hypothetical protein
MTKYTDADAITLSEFCQLHDRVVKFKDNYDQALNPAKAGRPAILTEGGSFADMEKPYGSFCAPLVEHEGNAILATCRSIVHTAAQIGFAMLTAEEKKGVPKLAVFCAF